MDTPTAPAAATKPPLTAPAAAPTTPEIDDVASESRMISAPVPVALTSLLTIYALT